jgi:hypothetical protein
VHSEQLFASVPIRNSALINSVPIHYKILNPTPAEGHLLPAVPAGGSKDREHQQRVVSERSRYLVLQGG